MGLELPSPRAKRVVWGDLCEHCRFSCVPVERGRLPLKAKPASRQAFSFLQNGSSASTFPPGGELR